MAWGLPPPGGGGKRGRDTKVSLPLLTPQPFLRTRLPSVARLKARGPQGRLVLQGTILDRSGAFRSDGANALHCLAAHCYARRLTQGKFRAVKRPKICPTHGTELPYPRLAEHLRCDGSKEGQGSQEGTGNHVWCPVPFCPPPWARRLRRRRRPMLTPSEGVISPPAARRRIGGTACRHPTVKRKGRSSPAAAGRRIGGTACRQQTVKRKKTSAEGIRKRLPFVKRAFFSCFTSAYAADFRNYSSTFT